MEHWRLGRRTLIFLTVLFPYVNFLGIPQNRRCVGELTLRVASSYAVGSTFSLRESLSTFPMLLVPIRRFRVVLTLNMSMFLGTMTFAPVPGPVRSYNRTRLLAMGPWSCFANFVGGGAPCFLGRGTIRTYLVVWHSGVVVVHLQTLATSKIFPTRREHARRCVCSRTCVGCPDMVMVAGIGSSFRWNFRLRLSLGV